MLGFGLRATWFSLSLSGLIACWITMIAFGRALRTYWGPILYCIGCTLMQGIFCLGLIYRMDPFQMPRAFCTAQSIIIGFASFLMSGVAAAFTMATCEAAKKPKSWKEGGSVALAWHRKYLFPLVVFPIFASVIQICVTLSQDSGHPTDDLHCDYAEPEWLRFLSYAGFPSLLALPCFFYSIRSIIQISKTNQHIQRAEDPGLPETVDTFTATPERPRRLNFRLGRMLSSSTCSFSSNKRRHPMKHKKSRSQVSHFVKGSRRDMTSEESTRAFDEEIKHVTDLESMRGSPVSSSFPTFAHPVNMGTVTINQDVGPARRSTDFDEGGLHRQPSENWAEVLGPLDSSIDIGEVTDPESDNATKRGDLEWNDESFQREESIYKGKERESEDESIEDGRPTRTARRIMHVGSGVFSKRNPLPHLDAGVTRIIIFQFCFALVQILCTLSTFIDVIKARHPPAAFGTQHVALLLSAWGPVLIFGIIPLFCRTYSFWLPWT